jgi:hypothetical protein
LSAYDAGVGGLIGGYPSVLVDRKVEVDPSDLSDAYAQYSGDFGYANITAAKTYNSSTRALTVDVSLTPAVDLSGDFRLALVLTEDGVTGTASGYNQTNYYSGGGSGVMGGFEGLTNPVPAADMHYDFVARYISGGFTGQAGSLPASMTAGTAYTYTFNTTVNNLWNDWNMRAIVMLVDVTNGIILNAANPQVVNGTVDPKSQISGLSLYPNPASDVLAVLVSLESSQDVTIDVVDVLGKTVASYNYNNVAVGASKVNLDIAGLASGVYFANVRTATGSVSRKFVKE